MSLAERLKGIIPIVCLILIGEMIFSLPFHVTRFFRPTMLQVFACTNLELGAMFSAYGVTAMIAYFPGGTIADRYSARKLMALAAFTTALGGIYMATIPSIMGMTALYGYWGVTSILLFWAAMIRATREWGGSSSQGKAFGLLEGGRGLVAAGVASVTVYLFSSYLPAEIVNTTDDERRAGLQAVIWTYTVLTALVGALVWMFIPDSEIGSGDDARKLDVKSIKRVLGMPAVWLIAMIVICAYCGYKALDNYSLFAVDAYGMNEVEGAKLSTWAAWIRPVAAVCIGIFADKVSSAKATTWSFSILVLSYALFVFITPDAGKMTILYITIFLTATVVYGLRGLYFALLEESKIPPAVTGTAVGVISLVGYTPDIFIMPVAGWLIDRTPGAGGHQHFFAVMMGISLLGLIAIILLRRTMSSAEAQAEPVL